MSTRKTEEWVFARDLKKGQKIEVAGMECIIVKAEDVFHYMPKARIRLTLDAQIMKAKKIERQMILSCHESMRVKIAK